LTGYLGLAAALLLAAVLVVAAVAKLADLAGTRRTVTEFGVPDALAPAVAVLLPVAELAAAALLVAGPTRAAGAAAALALLGIFCAAIGISLARGRAPDCHCFGQLHSAPAGRKTLARNGALAAVGAFVLVAALTHERPSAVGWLGRLGAAGVVAAAAIVFAVAVAILAAIAFVAVLRAHGRVLLRVDALETALRLAGIPLPEADDEAAPAGPVPSFELESVKGGRTSLDDLLSPGLPLVLVFAGVDCGPCHALLPDVAAWQHEHGDAVTVALAMEGAPERVRELAAEAGLERVLLDSELDVYRAFAADGTPSAALVSPDGEITHPLAAGADAVRHLVDVALFTGEEEETGLPVGSPVPELELPSLDGEPVLLGELRDSLVLFWNPDCGFCRSMHDDVLAWERRPPAGAPGLVVVSSGEAEATRAEGFRSTVVLDGEFEAGAAFGAHGTPMAVLLDADGRVAAPVATGAEAVFELAGGRPTFVEAAT
jgi:thiol-disulfide isomerase/thioredoxin